MKKESLVAIKGTVGEVLLGKIKMENHLNSKLIAICFSSFCSSNKQGSNKGELNRNLTNCPDCGHAIFWKRVHKSS